MEKSEIKATKMFEMLHFSYYIEVHGIFSLSLDLSDFPFDVQNLNLNIRFEDPRTICNIQHNPTVTKFVEMNLAQISQEDFTHHDPIVKVTSYRKKIMNDYMETVTTHFPEIKITFRIKRNSEAYI